MAHARQPADALAHLLDGSHDAESELLRKGDVVGKADDITAKLVANLLAAYRDAFAVLFFVSEEADYVTGQVLNVSGGWML